jgi:protein TonB
VPLADVDARTTAPTTLRAKPDITARAVARIPAETVVHIIGCDNDWCQVGVRRRVGYLPRGVLAAEPDRSLAEAAELPAEDPGQVFLEAVVDERPEVLSGPPLQYPDLLRKAGVQGRVLVQAIVNTNGRAEPSSVRILQNPDPGFESIAREYVLRAQFKPGRVRGHPVRVLVNLPIDFKIRRRTQ